MLMGSRDSQAVELRNDEVSEGIVEGLRKVLGQKQKQACWSPC
jgi:hypothetical protein